MHPTAALHVKHVRAERRNAFKERTVQSLDGSAHERDGDDANDDAERGEHGAHFVRADGVPRDAKAFADFGEQVHGAGWSPRFSSLEIKPSRRRMTRRACRAMSSSCVTTMM